MDLLSGDTDIIVLAVALLSEYKECVFLTDTYRQKQEQIPSGGIELEDSIISTFNWKTSFGK